MVRTRNKIVLVLCISLFFMGCANVKPYQRAHLNHPEMQTGAGIETSYEHNVHNYREGSSGGDGGKTGGGCGCN